MYLSCLLVDTGVNPDRPRPGRLWLRNVYRVHQRLCMAFPSDVRRSGDPEFLAPFVPGDFAAEDVHVARKENAGFLFRIDPQPPSGAVILVLSGREPDWDYAFHNARHLVRYIDVRPYSAAFTNSQRMRFRLAANPTYRASAKSIGANGNPIDPRWIGKRLPVRVDALGNWLERRATTGGFMIESLPLIQSGYVYFNKTCNSADGQRLHSVRYEGVLKVTDSDRLRETLIAGIGPAKAFGFGLLSIAPVPASAPAR